MTSGVRWRETMDQFAAQGIDTSVEIGPGNVLNGLVKRSLAGVTTAQIASAGGPGPVTRPDPAPGLPGAAPTQQQPPGQPSPDPALGAVGPEAPDGASAEGEVPVERLPPARWWRPRAAASVPCGGPCGGGGASPRNLRPC
jgi:hypothetical protein